MTQVEKIVQTCDDGCCAPPPLVLPTRPRVDRPQLIRKAFRLEWLTIGWMVVEAVVALASGIAAGSLVLVAFGLDSVIELVSAGVLVWRLSIELRNGEAFSEHAERIASRIGGALLFALAAYVVVAAGWNLWWGAGEEFSWPGLIVTLLAIPVMRYLAVRKLDLAEKLGIAFQLTNILRDVPKDYEMGRVYLPLEDLAQFGVRAEHLARGPLSPELQGLFEFEAARARGFYREGVELIPRVHSDSRAALWALARIYSSLLRRIEARGYDVFSERVRLSTPEKTGILLRARLGWYSQHNVLEERDRDRRRPGGTFLGRRAG